MFPHLLQSIDFHSGALFVNFTLETDSKYESIEEVSLVSKNRNSSSSRSGSGLMVPCPQGQAYPTTVGGWTLYDYSAGTGLSESDLAKARHTSLDGGSLGLSISLGMPLAQSP